VGGQVGVLPVPARPAADPAVAADPAGARKYTPRAYIFGRIWKYLRGFRLSSAPYGVLAWVRVQGTAAPAADSGQRPRPGLATASGDICSQPLPRPLWK